MATLNAANAKPRSTTARAAFTRLTPRPTKSSGGSRVPEKCEAGGGHHPGVLIAAAGRRAARSPGFQAERSATDSSWTRAPQQSDLDSTRRRTVRVGAGVVLDQ